MSTLNGFGTLYYGWRHAPDGTATATKWFALSWVPVIPLYREKLRVLTKFNAKRDTRPAPGGLGVSQIDRFELLEALPLSAKEVAITLARTYIGIPALLVGPMLLLVPVMGLLRWFGIGIEPGTLGFDIYMVCATLIFLNWLLQIVRAIRRTRGWQPNV